MPASTKIISGREIDQTLEDFDKRLSIFDTGSYAYLSQDDSLVVCPVFPSSTVIRTAGPDHLKVPQAGLLNLLVKDDKTNASNHA